MLNKCRNKAIEFYQWFKFIYSNRILKSNRVLILKFFEAIGSYQYFKFIKKQSSLVNSSDQLSLAKMSISSWHSFCKYFKIIKAIESYRDVEVYQRNRVLNICQFYQSKRVLQLLQIQQSNRVLKIYWAFDPWKNFEFIMEIESCKYVLFNWSNQLNFTQMSKFLKEIESHQHIKFIKAIKFCKFIKSNQVLQIHTDCVV